MIRESAVTDAGSAKGNLVLPGGAQVITCRSVTTCLRKGLKQKRKDVQHGEREVSEVLCLFLNTA